MYPERFKYKPTKRAPWILLEPGKIFIMGRSIPENPGEFYRPVHEWVSEYVNNYSGITKIILGFEYINTSSTKWVFTILRTISEMESHGADAKVIWYYEQGDEDMSELGFILRSLVECPFILVEVDEMNVANYEKIFKNLN
jgi:hypothetical protein